MSSKLPARFASKARKVGRAASAVIGLFYRHVL